MNRMQRNEEGKGVNMGVVCGIGKRRAKWKLAEGAQNYITT